MLKGDVIKKFNILLNSKENLLYNQILESFIKYFSDFEKDYIFEVESNKKSINIVIEEQGKYLFIDLTYTDLNIRYLHTEFYLFIKEIPLFEIIFLLDNFINGKYFFKTFLNKDKVVKQNLIFHNLNLEKYNQVDIYYSFFSFWRHDKITQVLLKRGYNWVTGQTT